MHEPHLAGKLVYRNKATHELLPQEEQYSITKRVPLGTLVLSSDQPATHKLRYGHTLVWFHRLTYELVNSMPLVLVDHNDYNTDPLSD